MLSVKNNRKLYLDWGSNLNNIMRVFKKMKGKSNFFLLPTSNNYYRGSRECAAGGG